MVCLECLPQSEFLGECDILVGNDVVMGVSITQGPEAVAWGKVCGIWRQKPQAWLKTSHPIPMNLFSHSQNRVVRPPQHLQVIEED